MVQFDIIKFCRTCKTILVTSGVSKKTLTKSQDYNRLFSRKEPTKKDMPNYCSGKFLSDGNLTLKGPFLVQSPPDTPVVAAIWFSG